jgi:hypothetical protein
MSNTVAAVKFEGTEKSYFYACEIEGLEKGDNIIVNADGKNKSVTFVGYVPSDIIGFVPNKKVLHKAVVNTTKTFTGVKTGGRNVRTKQQREADAKQLRGILQEQHPMMLSMRDIAEQMGWETDGASNLIKNAMSLEPKIVQVYKGWYTSKL